MTRKEEKIRQAVSELIKSSGCSCCRDDVGWEAAESKLGELLNIPKYEDGSGYDFYSSNSPEPITKQKKRV